MKILIVQPAVPKYRISLFNNLAKKTQLTVAASRVVDQVYSSEKILYSFIELGRIKKLYSFLWQRNVSSLFLKNFDVLVIWGNPKAISNIFLMMKAKLMGVPVILWMQLPKFTFFKKVFCRMLFSQVSAVLLYTDNEIDELRRIGFNHITVGALNNGLDKVAISQVRMDHEYSKNDFVFIGRDTKKAKISSLIESCKILYDRGIFFKLHLIGVDDAKFKDHEFVINHGIISDEKKIAQVINKCSFFVYAGDIGLSLIHAMCYGLPVLIHCNLKKHMPEIAALNEYQNAYFFQYEDIHSLSEQIEKLISIDTCRDRDFCALPNYSTANSALNIFELVSKTIISESKN